MLGRLLRETVCANVKTPEKLAANVGNDDATVRILTLGVRGHLDVIDKREVHETTLIGIHGSQGDLPLLTLRTGGSGTRDAHDLLLATALVALDVEMSTTIG